MKLPRRQFLHLAGGAAALPGLSRIARAQAYPTRPVTMVVPFAAGGAVDAYGRIIAAALSGPLHQQVIVENIGGAGVRPLLPWNRWPTLGRIIDEQIERRPRPTGRA